MKDIQLFKPSYHTDEVLEEIRICLEKGWTGLGFKTVEFEERWKEYSGLPNAHFLSSATGGLHLAVKILKKVNGWQNGDEVITTPITFVSTNHVIMYENLKPIFADVDEYLCLDPVDVESKITKKTKAIMFVGIGGNSGKLNDIKNICKKYKLKLILDGAHMAGTTLNKKHIGNEADVSVFSFQAVKNLPTADSGMICFKNEDYDALARKLSWLGIDKDTYSRTNSSGVYKWEYDVIDIGYKYHGNSIMAAIGLVQLKYLDDDNIIRNKISRLYEEKLDSAGIDYIHVHPDCVSSRHLFQIRVKNRDLIMNHLNNNGIYGGIHYKNNTLYSMYRYGFGGCPNSHKICNEIISLPLHLKLKESDCEYIVESLLEGNNRYDNKRITKG